MKRILLLVMSMLLAIVITSCMTPKEHFLKQGAERLTQVEIEKAYRGNTVKGQFWSAYYREDGARIVKVPSRGTNYKLKWWVAPDGRFCETSTNGKTNCKMEVYRKGGQYKVFGGGKVYEFKILAGNPMNLSE